MSRLNRSLDEIVGRISERATASNPTPEQLASWERKEDERRAQFAERQRLLACDDLAKKIGKRYSPAEVKLESYVIYHSAQKTVVERVMQLCQEPLSERGVVFYGPAGTGKDRFLAALMYSAIMRATHPDSCVSWWNGADLFGYFRDAIDQKTPETKLITEFSRGQLLAISDPTPPSGQLTSWNVSQLGRIIDRRYRDMKPTCITLNASSEADAQEILTAPIWGRLVENSEVIACRWPDFRTRKGS